MAPLRRPRGNGLFVRLLLLLCSPLRRGRWAGAGCGRCAAAREIVRAALCTLQRGCHEDHFKQKIYENEHTLPGW